VTGCKTEGTYNPVAGKANSPVPPKLLAELADKNMDVTSPILLRVFKNESELELWKKDRNGRFALLKTYPICKWSGDLGPKIKAGDRQAPEGFYEITPAQMNPNSQYHLSFNLGFPNAFDRAHDRTGAHLMVHGDCSSSGCYAVGDDQVAEIFALGRESFFGGQKSFQVQAYPFRMTASNMAKNRNNAHMPFWRMLKEGNDHFEVTRLEPKVSVCDKRYVFNASVPNGSFNARAACPAYEVPQEIASAVANKQRSDELQFAQLTARGMPTAPIKSGRDGGMHPTFIAKLQPREIIDERGNIKLVVDRSSAGATNTAYSPSGDSEVTSSTTASAPAAQLDVPRDTRHSQAGHVSQPNFADRIARFFSSGSPDPTGAPHTQVASADRNATQQAVNSPENRSAKNSRAARPRGAADTSEHIPSIRPSSSMASGSSKTKSRAGDMVTSMATATDPATPAAASSAAVINGAQPIPSASNFDSRWSGSK